MARARRSEKRFASVAVSVNCHDGSPNRRVSSSPTHAASSVGSIVVMPRRSCRSTAAITGAGTVAGHGARVAEAQVDVVVAVGAGRVGARRGLQEERERARPT